MKLLKKYKWIILGFFVLFLIVIIWAGKDLFLAHDGAIYGDRLDGIKNASIGADVKKGIVDLFTSTPGVTKADDNVQGLILYVDVYVDETMTVDKIKEVANNALTKLSDDQKKSYDVQFLVAYATNSKKTDFPIIGYKNKNNDVIVW